MASGSSAAWPDRRERKNKAAGADRHLDQAVARLRKELSDPSEGRGRHIAKSLALTLQGALLVRHGHPAVADAFVASRLTDSAGWGRASGTLPTGIDTAAITGRVTPRE